MFGNMSVGLAALGAAIGVGLIGMAASAASNSAASHSQPFQRKRDAPLTSVPRLMMSRTRATSEPTEPRMCWISSVKASSCATTGVSAMYPAASLDNFTRTLCGNAMPFSLMRPRAIVRE